MDSAAVGIFSSSQGELLFLGLPDFVWSGIFSLLATLIAGVVVATFTTAFLKKREEKIRVSGELFQRRVEAQSALSNFLIQRLVFETVEEMDPDVLRLVGGVELADTHLSPQRSKIFDSLEDCNRFLDDYRQLFYSNKTWLDRRVRDQLLLIQYYLEAISGVWFYATKVPLPDSGSLTEEELDLIQGCVIRVVGVGRILGIVATPWIEERVFGGIRIRRSRLREARRDAGCQEASLRRARARGHELRGGRPRRRCLQENW